MYMYVKQEKAGAPVKRWLQRNERGRGSVFYPPHTHTFHASKSLILWMWLPNDWCGHKFPSQHTHLLATCIIHVAQLYLSWGEHCCRRTLTIKSHNYAPPFVHCQHWAKQVEGLTCGSVIFTCSDHYHLTNATWACDFCTSSGSLMNKTWEKQQSHNMTQNS